MDNWIELLTFFLAVAGAVTGAVAGFMIWLVKILRHAFAFEHKTLKNEGDIAEVRADLKEFRGEVRAEFKEIRTEMKEFMGEIRTEMKEFMSEIRTEMKEQSSQVNFASSNSPLALNDVGEKISKAVNAPDFAKRYAVLVKIPEDADELEIQETSFKYAKQNLLDELNGEEVKKLRKYVFDSGNDMHSVMSIIGFELRDIILKERGLFPDRLKKKG